MKKIVLFTFIISTVVFPQDDLKEKEKALKASTDITFEANKELADNDFIDAEVNYRRAISKSNENTAAPYNLGNAYYNKESFSEAFGRFKEAGELTSEKPVKHKAFHNMGNVFMKGKEYAKAVDAYKNSLRNNSKDDETRYNLALAQKLLKNQADNKEKDKDNKEKNKDNKDKDKDNKDKNKDKKDQNKEKQEGDKGDKDKDKKGDNKNDKNKDKQGENDKKKKNPEPKKNQLSKEQIKQLLEAMNNEENKTQKKVNAKKARGRKVKQEKDW